MTQLAMPCANGAVPKPDWVGKSIQLSMTWLPADVLALISSVSPLSVSQQIVGTAIASTLCSNQVQDPGDLSLGNLLWDLAGAAIPNPNGSPGTLGWWIGQKLAYYAFFQVCQCSGTGTPPPSPVTPHPPSGSQPYPTDPNSQPQLTRIENNQQTSGDGLTTIYNGLQLGVTDLRDLSFRLRASSVLPYGATMFTMMDEGQHVLWPDGAGGTAVVQDVYGIQVNLTAIPPTVKRRGEVYQRLYGVGSIEWNCQPIEFDPHVIVRRDSLHYEQQFIVAPQGVENMTVRWRLQPGVQAVGYQVFRNPQRPVYRPNDPDPAAYQTFSNWTPPPNWSDAPFYPRTAELRELPTGGGLPPAEFPCCG